MPLDELLTCLDPRPGVRGRQFERICAWYLRSAPRYRDRFRQVWLWDEWPGAWAADAGIDLVAEEHDGGLWAIQAKAYGTDYAIKKADLDSFLAESSRPGFTYRLLIATTDRLGARARRTLDDQREQVGYRLRSDLELEQLAWPASPDDLRPRRSPPKRPFPHVREAVRETVKGFERTDRGQLRMACGTGKTLAAMWIAERLDSRRTLVLVPSLSLLAQTLREWSANASKPFDYLAVCSDETVAGEDEFVQHPSELGLPVTTDPDLIAAFLRRHVRRVVFVTYQSSPQIAEAHKGRVPGFDLAVADEAHRCAGRVGSEFTTILDADRIRSKRRLFMTATPRLYTPRLRREAGVADVEVASMDDEAVFGPVLHRLSFGEGIERDLLSDYQVVVVGVDDETYRGYAERGEFVSRDGKKITDARTLAGQIGLAKTMRKYDLRRTISFHSRVKAAREFSAEMPGVIGWMPTRARPGGTLWSNHVSGTMTSGGRDRLLLSFRDLAPNERGLLSNARCLGEGVDVPSIDGVAFIDPRRSTIDIVQALGRAIRKSRDKKVGTIVLPVFLSADEDPDQVLDESSFKHVWDVLKALRAHDEALGEELDELRRRLGAGGRRPGGRARSSSTFRQAGSALVSSTPSMRDSSSRPPRRGNSGTGCSSDSSSAKGMRELHAAPVRMATRSTSGSITSARPPSEGNLVKSSALDWRLYQAGCGTQPKQPGRKASQHSNGLSSAKATRAWRRATGRTAISSANGSLRGGPYSAGGGSTRVVVSDWSLYPAGCGTPSKQIGKRDSRRFSGSSSANATRACRSRTARTATSSANGSRSSGQCSPRGRSTRVVAPG
jgi:predicted helicase